MNITCIQNVPYMRDDGKIGRMNVTTNEEGTIVYLEKDDGVIDEIPFSLFKRLLDPAFVVPVWESCELIPPFLVNMVRMLFSSIGLARPAGPCDCGSPDCINPAKPNSAKSNSDPSFVMGPNNQKN